MSESPSTSASPYGTLPPASAPAQRKPVSLPRLLDMHARGEKITMLTAYDANGDLDRESFLVEVKNGRQVVVATLPALSKK